MSISLYPDNSGGATDDSLSSLMSTSFEVDDVVVASKSTAGSTGIVAIHTFFYKHSPNWRSLDYS